MTDLGGSSPDPLQWDLIKLLIKHYPESVHKANHVGMLPIHSVARLDEDVFHTLMDQYPAGVMAKDNEGKLNFYTNIHRDTTAYTLFSHFMHRKPAPTLCHFLLCCLESHRRTCGGIPRRSERTQQAGQNSYRPGV